MSLGGATSGEEGMKSSRIGVALAGLRLCGEVQAGSDLGPGQREIAIQLDMPGSPVAMPPIKQTMPYPAGRGIGREDHTPARSRPPDALRAGKLRHER
jgi:hypothetical protein